MKVGIVYATAQPVQLNCRVDDGSTVRQAIESSGILKFCPDIDLAQQKVGVFGKFVKLDAQLSEGDRIEIYRRITKVVDEDDEDIE